MLNDFQCTEVDRVNIRILFPLCVCVCVCVCAGFSIKSPTRVDMLQNQPTNLIGFDLGFASSCCLQNGVKLNM